MKIYIIGAGMGSGGDLTCDGKKAIDESSLLLGSKRMLSLYADRRTAELPVAVSDILETVKTVTEDVVSLLFSGDVSFFSNGVRVFEKLRDEGYDVSLIPGISSASYFCSRIGLPLDGTEIVSSHGRYVNLVAHIRDRKRVFSLLSGAYEVIELAEKLFYYGMDKVRLWAGVSLSSEEEYVVCLSGGDAIDGEVHRKLEESGKKPSVIYALNENSRNAAFDAVEDDDFIRNSATKGIIPMTKHTVRTVCLEQLKLERDSVLCDVGAGSGSVSVAAALMSPDISVTAVEYEAEACLLIAENRRKFLADNIEIVNGRAPEAFKGMKTPTHAFIGGSSGNIGEILETLFELNPQIRIVATVISLTTLTTLMDYLGRRDDLQSKVMQLQESDGRRAGGHTLMIASNPVYVITVSRAAGAVKDK